MARKTDKTMTIKMIGEDGTAVLIEGEPAKPGDIVTVPLDVARNLIYRERAVKYDEAADKPKSKADKSA
jgi:hypothetical protein